MMLSEWKEGSKIESVTGRNQHPYISAKPGLRKKKKKFFCANMSARTIIQDTYQVNLLIIELYGWKLICGVIPGFCIDMLALATLESKGRCERRPSV